MDYETMYLLIGHESDPCCQIVSALLRKHGYIVYATAEPLAGGNIFCWTLDTLHSASSLRWYDGQIIHDDAWNGVLVRSTGELANPTGWEPDDLAYTQAETQAALLAWLQSLPCPVVNRLSAELWFRPRRPFVEWHKFFVLCGLPTLAVQITNDLAAAQHFSSRWDGKLIYAPLTSWTRYPVDTDQQWSRLAHLMEHLPVALIEPYHGGVCYATLIGQQVIWSTGSHLSGLERDKINAGLRQLAHILQLDLVQIELLVEANDLRCIDVHIFPRFAAYSLEEQLAIGEGVMALLTNMQGRR